MGGNNQRLIYGGGKGEEIPGQRNRGCDESGRPSRRVYTPPEERERERERWWCRGGQKSTGLSAGDKRSAMQGSIAALQPRMVDGHARDGYG